MSDKDIRGLQEPFSSPPDEPESCDKCPRDYYHTIHHCGEEYHLCRTHYNMYLRE